MACNKGETVPSRIEDIPKDLIVDFDITDPTLADPHQRLAEIQATTPIAYAPYHGGYWLVTRYEDVHEVARNYEIFSNECVSVPKAMVERSIPLEYDPPEHTAYRQILNPLFSPARMKALSEQIRIRATNLINAFIERGRCDFISEFAHPLPTATFLDLVGWPQADAPLFSDWTEDILVGRPGAPLEEDTAIRMKASQEVFAYFQEMVTARRRSPGDDATSLLISSRYNGERSLTEQELLASLWLLMLGGLHTVRGVLGFGLLQLMAHPAQRQSIVSDPSLIPSAVEEMLRLEAPVTSGRMVAKPTEFRGVTMQPGDMVLVFLSAANRDPDHFAEPDDFRLDRGSNRHLTFSGGPHRCVGSHLGRVELVVAMEEIHRRLPDYRLVEGTTFRRHHGQVRGIYELPIEFTPGH